MSDQNDEHIRIQAHELFDPQVDKALSQQRQGRERIVADPPPVSPIKRLLLNSLFYLPFASVLGALACWMMLEPKIDDFPVVGGEVQLINSDPFDTGPGMKSLTIGNNEVYVDPDKTEFEVGAQGQPAFTSFDQIQVGTKVEATGLEQGSRLIAASIRPTDDPSPRGNVDKPMWPLFLLFPLTAALIALGLLLAEGLAQLDPHDRALVARQLHGGAVRDARLPAGRPYPVDLAEHAARRARAWRQDDRHDQGRQRVALLRVRCVP